MIAALALLVFTAAVVFALVYDYRITNTSKAAGRAAAIRKIENR